jgi:hypothetical protein
MRRLVAIALSGVLVCALPTLAADLAMGLSGFSVSMAHINTLIEEFDPDTELDLSPLRTGAGIEVSGTVLPIGDIGSIGVGGRGLLVREVSRDVSINASMIALFAQGKVALGRWMASVDAGACYGMFSFPTARLVSLSGFGVGLVGRAGYRLPVSERFALTFDLGLQWLSVPEMKDAVGQRYRGRGTPFMDFSGISASIGLTWVIPERSNE